MFLRFGTSSNSFRLVAGSMALSICTAAVALPGCEHAAAPPSPPAVVNHGVRMRQAMRRGDWEAARADAERALIVRPDDPDLITDAAQIHAMLGQKREAGALMADAAEHSQFEPRRVEYAIHALVDAGDLYGVIGMLRKAVAVHPSSKDLRIKLLGFLKEAQRNDLIEPHYRWLIQNRAFDLPLLVAFTDAPQRKYSAKTYESLRSRNPDDRRIRLAEALDLHDSQRFAESLRLCEQILERHPSFPPAYALGAWNLALLRRFAELEGWLAQTPSSSKPFASHWLAKGAWAEHEGRYAQAARAFWQATRRDPNNSTAWSRLAMTLRLLRSGDSPPPDTASPQTLARIEKRLADLISFRKALSDFIWGNYESQRSATEVAKFLFRSGRLWEAEAWAAVATTLSKDTVDELPDVRRAIIAELNRDRGWMAEGTDTALALDLSNLPADDDGSGDRSPAVAIQPQLPTAAHVRLVDQSDQWGLAGIGAGSDPSDPRRTPLTRSTGIGGGAIDFDLDGHTDAIVMGAGGAMFGDDSGPNDLLRNLGTMFVRVPASAGVGFTDFGQGCAVGDFNEDGLPDLFLANLGRNRLLRNNGDGTFSECSAQMDDHEGLDWTTCGVFADINDDGITDLLAANYCATEAQPDKPCPNAEGVLGTCHPLRFRGQPNLVFAATPDGRFRNRSSQWLPDVSPGRTMGVLAGRLAAEQFAIFLANDMSANRFYTYHDAPEMGLSDSAVLRGLAVDGRTRPQASMGIAAGDLDSDGDLDLFVTGFANEHNVCYEQVTPGYWRDESAKFGLLAPSLSTVGFGTAAIDLDGDGIDEIAVTNGHIGKFDDDVAEYRQPFQLYRRAIDGRFHLVDDDRWGEYFSQPHVGRSLWTVDVDGDLRGDLMITHTRESVRLLINRCDENNHRIAFSLVGTKCSRDAVGAVVRFRHDDRRRILWRLSGDGYQCSNEAVLRAGIGPSRIVRDVTVTWRDGSTDRVGDLPADAHYVIIQGQPSASRIK